MLLRIGDHIATDGGGHIGIALQVPVLVEVDLGNIWEK